MDLAVSVRIHLTILFGLPLMDHHLAQLVATDGVQHW